jgi:hypothetical protein
MNRWNDKMDDETRSLAVRFAVLLIGIVLGWAGVALLVWVVWMLVDGL